MPAVIRKASRYYKQKLEYTWLFLFIMSVSCLSIPRVQPYLTTLCDDRSSIAVPIALYYVCVDKLPETRTEKLAMAAGGYHWWRAGFDRFWQARLISFFSWFAIAAVFFCPILLWKHAGRSSVNKMLQKWENEDQAARPSGSEIPHWHLGYIGIFGSTVVRPTF